jgi:hypothetical protein
MDAANHAGERARRSARSSAAQPGSQDRPRAPDDGTERPHCSRPTAPSQRNKWHSMGCFCLPSSDCGRQACRDAKQDYVEQVVAAGATRDIGPARDRSSNGGEGGLAQGERRRRLPGGRGGGRGAGAAERPRYQNPMHSASERGSMMERISSAVRSRLSGGGGGRARVGVQEPLSVLCSNTAGSVATQARAVSLGEPQLRGKFSAAAAGGRR